jgi:hypothetical protein
MSSTIRSKHRKEESFIGARESDKEADDSNLTKKMPEAALMGISNRL